MKSSPVRGVPPPVTIDLRLGGRGLSPGGFSPASWPCQDRVVAPASLWSAFWQEFCLEGQPHERCHIPGDGRFAVDRHWARFAAALPHGAQVIDLGCGSGIVGRTLLGHRDDLHVTGIDFADVPTAGPDHLTIHPRVSMEDMPFDGGRFDAAISLFGIEYGDIDRTARELERVLKQGARFSFLVHHDQSEIVREGRRRRSGLTLLLADKVKEAFLAGSVTAIEEQIRRLITQCPEEPSVSLFSRYLRHHVAGDRAVRQAMWQNLLDGLGPEIALLAQLDRSAKSAAGMGRWIVPLLATMNTATISVLRRDSGEPIAWQIDGSR